MAENTALQEEHILQEWPLEEWHLRPWALGGLLALCGLGIHLASGETIHEEPWRAALAALFGFGGIAAAFTLDGRAWKAPVLFALAIGVIMAGIAWQLVAADGHRAGVEYAFAAGCFFSLLALPLFQAGFYKTRFSTSYPLAHFHAWADAVSGGGALAFVGLSWALLALLNGLFGLVGFDFIDDLMAEEWFGWMWSGAAFGAGLGVIRNNLKVVGALQKVVMLVFAILAVPFAAGLLLFLLILLGTGGQALWEATDSATPILLACAAGAFVLTNAIIRDDDAERSENAIMQWAALVLAALILPLSVFAALSMGIRIDQHGLSPERIWGGIAIAVSVAFGLASWVAIVRGRIAGWMAQQRAANLNLAAGVCGLALILALPFWDFGAMSAKNQIARLQSGAVSVEDFDFAALRWDFGDAGREALAQLSAGEGEVAQLAAEAEAQESRPYRGVEDFAPRTDRLANFTSNGLDEESENAMRAMIRNEQWRCQSPCVAIDLGQRAPGVRHLALIERDDIAHLELRGDGVLRDFYPPAVKEYGEGFEPAETSAQSQVEVRDVTVRQVYVDGSPVGAPFE